jgi:hypothetical protein
MSTHAVSSKPTIDSYTLSQLPVVTEPFHHVIQNEFIDSEHYKQLYQSFPTCPPHVGPTGFSVYWGDEEYQELLHAQPAWQKLFNTFHSQLFIDWCREQFAEVWDQEGCRIDLSRARYVPYREDRIDKERRTLRKVEHEPHELWVRMDIHQGRMGYDRPVHLDHARRLVSMLIYMCDRRENEMTGGELLLHGVESKGPRPFPFKRVAPGHNLMVAFPCTSRSYHSVSTITAQRAPRNYVQVHLSSSIDAWTHPEVPRWRRSLGALKRKVLNYR